MNNKSFSLPVCPKRKLLRLFPNAFLVAIMASCFVAAISEGRAQTFQTWRGEASSGSWQGSTNWWNFPNGSPIVQGQQEWDNNHYTDQTNNNSGSTLNTWRWLFKAGASSAHNFTGDAVRFFDSGGNDPSIINQSSATHTISMNLAGDGTAGDPLNIQIDNDGGGGLTFGGAITNQGSDLRVIGSAASNAVVTFNGVISGTGGFYKENANITVVMTNANDYSGQTTIQSGTMRLAGAGSLANSAVRLHSGGTLSISNNATVSSVAEFASANSGAIAISNGAVLTVTADSLNLFQGSITGAGGLTKQGSHTLSLFGTQSYSGSTTVSNGVLSVSVPMSTTAVTVSGGTFATTATNLLGDSVGVTINGGAYSVGGSDTIGVLSGSGGQVSITDGTTLTTSFASSSNSYQGVIAGAGALTKSGSGTLTLSGSNANSYTGLTTVSGGTLNLSKTPGTNAIAGNLTVSTNATLLLSASYNITNTSAVTLSGGTITRGTGVNGTGVNEAFASLNLTTGSFLDFGTGSTGSMTFGTYEDNTTPNAVLTINNFLPGNSFTFSNAQFAANGSNIGSYFTFGTGFVNRSITDNTGGSFTITAIPEPSTYVAAAGLLAMFLWPVRRRVIKDLKSILGLRPTGRERIEAYRNA